MVHLHGEKILDVKVILHPESDIIAGKYFITVSSEIFGTVEYLVANSAVVFTFDSVIKSKGSLSFW